jgi:hypothetical protein
MATSNDEDRRKAVQYGDQRVERGHGGETHQIATGSSPRLTTQQRTLVSDQNTLRGDAAPLFEAARLSRLIDDGFISLDETAAAEFISRCAELRFWSRQLSVAGARAR